MLARVLGKEAGNWKRGWIVGLALLAFASCRPPPAVTGEDSGTPVEFDAGGPDVDAGEVDAGAPDAGAPDSGLSDGGTRAGVPPGQWAGSAGTGTSPNYKLNFTLGPAPQESAGARSPKYTLHGGVQLAPRESP